MDKLTDSQKGAGQAAETANPHFEKSRELFTAINQVVTGLGHDLHAAFAGPLGPIILLALGIAEVKKLLGEYNKALDEQGADAAQPMIDAVKEVQTAWDDAKTKFGEYLGAVADAGKNKDPIDEQIKRERAIEEANLKGLGKNLTPEQRGHLKQSLNVGELEHEFNERNTPGYQEHLNRTERDAINNAAAAGIKVEENKSELEKTRALLDPNTETGKKFQADQDRASGMLQAGLEMQRKHPDEGWDTSEAQAEVDRLAKERANLEARQRELEGEKTTLAQQKTEADDAAAAAKKEGVWNVAKRASLSGEIDNAILVQQQQETIEKLSSLFAKYAEGQKTLNGIVAYHIEHALHPYQAALRRTLKANARRKESAGNPF